MLVESEDGSQASPVRGPVQSFSKQSGTCASKLSMARQCKRGGVTHVPWNRYSPSHDTFPMLLRLRGMTDDC